MQRAGQGSFDCEGCIPDTINGAKFVRDLYEKAEDKTGESFFVPGEHFVWYIANFFCTLL